MSNENDTRIPIVTLLVTQRGEDFGCRGVAGGTPGLPFSLPYSKPLTLNSKIRQSIAKIWRETFADLREENGG